jgi:hypothetical protein
MMHPSWACILNRPVYLGVCLNMYTSRAAPCYKIIIINPFRWCKAGSDPNALVAPPRDVSRVPGLRVQLYFTRRTPASLPPVCDCLSISYPLP